MSRSAGGPRLYAESSAVLSWLLGQARGDEALRCMQTASSISTSDLTIIECDRAVHRRFALGDINSMRANELRADVATFAASWNVIRIAPEILLRARHPFPEEPIRALDALHIASALHARTFAPNLAILSFNDRIRRVGASLGFPLLPT